MTCKDHPHCFVGHGTIGLEILDKLQQVDTIICPYGSGGLITGIASAVNSKPDVKVLACEVETAAPLSASLQAGKMGVSYVAFIISCLNREIFFSENINSTVVSSAFGGVIPIFATIY